MTPSRILIILVCLSAIGGAIWYFFTKKKAVASPGTTPSGASTLVGKVTPASPPRWMGPTIFSPTDPTYKPTPIIPPSPTPPTPPTPVVPVVTNVPTYTDPITTTPVVTIPPTPTTSTTTTVTPTTPVLGNNGLSSTTTYTDPQTGKTIIIQYSSFLVGKCNTDVIGYPFALQIDFATPVYENQLRIRNFNGKRDWVNPAGIPVEVDYDGNTLTYDANGNVVLYKNGFRPPQFRYNAPMSQSQLDALSNRDLLGRINLTAYSQGVGFLLETTDTDAYNTLQDRLSVDNGYIDSNGVQFSINTGDVLQTQNL